jgi:hypothetical protein
MKKKKKEESEKKLRQSLLESDIIKRRARLHPTNAVYYCKNSLLGADDGSCLCKKGPYSSKKTRDNHEQKCKVCSQDTENLSTSTRFRKEVMAGMGLNGDVGSDTNVIKAPSNSTELIENIRAVEIVVPQSISIDVTQNIILVLLQLGISVIELEQIQIHRYTSSQKFKLEA